MKKYKINLDKSENEEIINDSKVRNKVYLTFFFLLSIFLKGIRKIWLIITELNYAKYNTDVYD